MIREWYNRQKNRIAVAEAREVAESEICIRDIGDDICFVVKGVNIGSITWDKEKDIARLKEIRNNYIRSKGNG